MPFRALGLDGRILRAIQEAGYTEPTPIQAAAIPPILSGHDLIGIAQTGTGKTAAFTLPILHRLVAENTLASAPATPGHGPSAHPTSPSHSAHAHPSHSSPAPHQPSGAPKAPSAPAAAGGLRGTRALILAPTRELAVQIEENVRAYARHLPLRVATVFGGVGERPQIDALRSGTTIIIACPGRLLDLMGRRFADFTGLRHLVLDEADRMLDMGFLPSIRQIVRTLPARRQTLLFSATLSQEIEALTKEFQRQPRLVQIGRRSNPAETVQQWVYEVSKPQKPALLEQLLRDPGMSMVLVFSRMKHGADRIARQLEQKGIRTATLHSNRSQNQRLRALREFKDGQVRVLVATDIAARGIDVDGISHVVNYDFPLHPEDYVHRIGRTGRAHAVGDAISFVTPEDHGALRALERFIGRGIVRRRAGEPPAPSDSRKQPLAHARSHEAQEAHKAHEAHAGHTPHGAPVRPPAPTGPAPSAHRSPGPHRPSSPSHAKPFHPNSPQTNAHRQKPRHSSSPSSRPAPGSSHSPRHDSSSGSNRGSGHGSSHGSNRGPRHGSGRSHSHSHGSGHGSSHGSGQGSGHGQSRGPSAGQGQSQGRSQGRPGRDSGRGPRARHSRGKRWSGR